MDNEDSKLYALTLLYGVKITVMRGNYEKVPIHAKAEE